MTNANYDHIKQSKRYLNYTQKKKKKKEKKKRKKRVEIECNASSALDQSQ